MTQLSPAEQILQSLGITEPKEIELPTIAFHLGAQVRICPLDGCEARILGCNDRAIIRVSDKVPPRRQRFSIGHEIGHWHHHRNQALLCSSDEIGNYRTGGNRRERTADEFSADMLLPPYILDPIAQQFRQLDSKMVREIADLFETSITATAIRLIERRHGKGILVCHNKFGRTWFKRSIDVPELWFPRQELDPTSYAFSLLFGNAPEQKSGRTIKADAWFDCQKAQYFDVQEYSIKTSTDHVVTLLSFTNQQMLAA